MLKLWAVLGGGGGGGGGATALPNPTHPGPAIAQSTVWGGQTQEEVSELLEPKEPLIFY